MRVHRMGQRPDGAVIELFVCVVLVCSGSGGGGGRRGVGGGGVVCVCVCVCACMCVCVQNKRQHPNGAVVEALVCVLV